MGISRALLTAAGSAAGEGLAWACLEPFKSARLNNHTYTSRCFCSVFRQVHGVQYRKQATYWSVPYSLIPREPEGHRFTLTSIRLSLGAIPHREGTFIAKRCILFLAF